MKKADKISNTAFYLCLMLFILSFNFQDNPSGGWYQQFVPDLGSRQITDIEFADSLTGYAVTTLSDSGYIFKTTNGGDNWFSSFKTNKGFKKVKFINENTGYVCGAGGGCAYLGKTTNGGINWTTINTPCTISWEDMSILNEDTIWVVDDNSFNGGVFRTTNGGSNWTNQFSGGSQNPAKIYMVNANTGFISYSNNTSLRKTTNGGFNWTQITGENGFLYMYFADSLTGWKSFGFMKKTTDGGLNWITQTTQTGGYIQTSGIFDFSNINADTMWGVGGYVLYPNNQVRAILHRTTNGGDNWHYQIPDTSVLVFPSYVDFVNNNNGWAYDNAPTGIHTKIGGDSIFLSVQQISSEIPIDFELFQNYPNPFNPSTSIKFKVQSSKNVRLSVFDVTGREVAVLVNEKLSAGEYQYMFDGSGLSSGIYFYSLFAENAVIDTKKMLMIK